MQPCAHAVRRRHILARRLLLAAETCPSSCQPLHLPTSQARTTVVEFLKEKGLFRGTLDNPMRLGLCSRWVLNQSVSQHNECTG